MTRILRDPSKMATQRDYRSEQHVASLDEIMSGQKMDALRSDGEFGGTVRI